jgi:hypothetical protein
MGLTLSERIDLTHQEPDVDRERSIAITLALGGLALIGVAYVVGLLLGRFPYVWTRLVVYEAIVGVLVATLYVGTSPAS